MCGEQGLSRLVPASKSPARAAREASTRLYLVLVESRDTSAALRLRHASLFPRNLLQPQSYQRAFRSRPNKGARCAAQPWHMP